jgi:(S)-ureidoglycine aminohydrolase
MKYILLFCLLISKPLFGQIPLLESKVYSIDERIVKTKFGSKSSVFKGEGDALKLQEMNVIRIKGKKKYTVKASADREYFFILKNGNLKISLGGKEQVLQVGSMVTVMPKDQIIFENTEGVLAELYEMSYLAKSPMNSERGIKAGGSFIVPWESAVFKPTAKGGGRQFFDRATAMLNRFDIHVTTLNVGQQSHDPHTHANEEIILMMDGNAEERIGDKKELAKPGDVIRLGSKVLHNITNVGNKPCQYYAIQWN